MIDLQREDGAYGYTYSQHERKVLDWVGWLLVCSCLCFGYRQTQKSHYNSARKAVNYYAVFVQELNCWGTPMDTYKAVDEREILHLFALPDCCMKQLETHIFGAVEERC